MPMEAVRVRMSILKDIIYESLSHGVRLEEICYHTGLSKADLEDADRWVGLEQASKVWSEAVRLSGDAHLGLRIGQHPNPYVAGIVGYLMESSPDLGTAIEALAEFGAVFANMLTYAFRQTESQLQLLFIPAQVWWQQSPDTARQAIETSMTRTLAIIRLFTGKPVFPLEARFQYPLTGNAKLYQEVLGCPLRFSESENVLCFDRSIWNLPVKSFHPQLFNHFYDLAQAALQELQVPKTMADQIRKTVFTHFQGYWPSMEQVAAQCRLHPRSMQRRLKEEGSSFQILIDDIRKEMAIDVLQKDGSSIRELAQMLGYSEASTFRRAFKRWTGMTPGQFQKVKT